MPSGPSHFLRFIRRVHRRLLILRLVEGAGLGVLAAAAAALLLIPISFYQGRSGLGMALVLLASGATTGAMWAMLRRDPVIAAAEEADRQLDLADLLSTSWLLWRDPRADSREFTRTAQRAGTSEFANAVLAMADSRCAGLSPSDVILARLGASAWGGIGLAAALVLTLGLMTTQPLESRAAIARQRDLARNSTAFSRTGAHLSAGLTSENNVRPPSAFAPDQPGDPDRSLDPMQNTATMREPTGSNPTDSSANPEGAGGGVGRSHASGAQDTTTPEGTNATASHPGGAIAGGTGKFNTNAADLPRGPSGQSTGHAPGASAAPPWQTPAWPAAQSSADTALRTGQIPADYHDLLREYFTR